MTITLLQQHRQQQHEQILVYVLNEHMAKISRTVIFSKNWREKNKQKNRNRIQHQLKHIDNIHVKKRTNMISYDKFIFILSLMWSSTNAISFIYLSTIIIYSHNFLVFDILFE
jgi:ribonuclease P protein component